MTETVESLFKHYVEGQVEPLPPPPITQASAAGLLVLYTVAYVAPFYLSPKTRPSPTLSRDAPAVIKARITSVTLTCLVCSLATLAILMQQGQLSAADALHAMGYWPLGLAASARAVLLTAILFAGPLFETLVVNQGWRDWVRLEPLRDLLGEWTLWRNIVAGPVTEEVLFRAAAVPLMVLARAPPGRTVLLSPLIFGLAHAHHLYEFRLTHPRVPAAAAAARSLLQLAYTSLFGAYATFLLLRCASLPALCLVHAFCNAMGLPRLWGRVRPPPEDGEGADASRAWTVAYYALLVGGAVGFWKNLWPLTENPGALVQFASR